MGTSGEVSVRRVENAFLMESGVGLEVHDLVIPKSGSPESFLHLLPLGPTLLGG